MQRKREYLCEVSQAKPLESPIYRHPLSKDGFPQPQDPRKTNLQQQILIQFQSFLNKKTLGVFNDQNQTYDHITYKEVLDTSQALGSSFEDIQLVTDQQGITIRPIGIYLSNRREWTLIDLATILYGFTSCPFYDTLGVDSITYAMNLTKISICFVQQNTAKFIAESNLPHLKQIVTVGQMDEDLLIKLKTKNLQIYTWDEFLQRGKENIKPYPNINPKTPFTLIFTSGTTGQPKATVQTHSNFLIMMQALFEQQDQFFPLTQDDVYLSYLPLPHIFERIVQLAALSGGAEVNYSSGIIQNIAQDIQRCKPTYFITVPRILNRFYEGIKSQINQLPVDIQTKFNQALELKKDYIAKSGKMTHDQLDVAFAKTRNILGGRQRLIITGAAPISQDVLDFLKATLCCQIIEVYGQTETAGGSFLTDYQDGVSGHIGGPTISQEFKLVSVPDMNYFTDPNVDGKVRGEIYIRGASVIPGYFDNPKQTSEIVDQEGWVHTGDVGEIVNGTVKIIDRKNNLFKLSQGKYLSSETIERCYLKLPGINEILIFGDSLQDYPIGIVVPDPNVLQQWSAQINEKGDHEQLCQNNAVRRFVLDLLINRGKQKNLNGFEQVCNIYLESKPFAQVGILTDTLKVQRNKAKIHYQNIIQNLYKKL